MKTPPPSRTTWGVPPADGPTASNPPSVSNPELRRNGPLPPTPARLQAAGTPPRRSSVQTLGRPASQDSPSRSPSLRGDDVLQAYSDEWAADDAQALVQARQAAGERRQGQLGARAELKASHDKSGALSALLLEALRDGVNMQFAFGLVRMGVEQAIVDRVKAGQVAQGLPIDTIAAKLVQYGPAMVAAPVAYGATSMLTQLLIIPALQATMGRLGGEHARMLAPSDVTHVVPDAAEDQDRENVAVQRYQVGQQQANKTTASAAGTVAAALPLAVAGFARAEALFGKEPSVAERALTAMLSSFVAGASTSAFITSWKLAAHHQGVPLFRPKGMPDSKAASFEQALDTRVRGEAAKVMGAGGPSRKMANVLIQSLARALLLFGATIPLNYEQTTWGAFSNQDDGARRRANNTVNVAVGTAVMAWFFFQMLPRVAKIRLPDPKQPAPDEEVGQA